LSISQPAISLRSLLFCRLISDVAVPVFGAPGLDWK